MTDPWRYRCPDGHTNIETRVRTMQNDTGIQYRCRTCEKTYERLIDVKTGKEVSRCG